VATDTEFQEADTRDYRAVERGRQIVLIPALQAVQVKLGYVPREAMEEIGDLAGVSPNTVYGVASFYAQFRYIKPGKHMVKICLGTACHVCGATGIVDSLERELHIKEGRLPRTRISVWRQCAASAPAPWLCIGS